MAFADAFHMAIDLKHDIQNILYRDICLYILTDSRGLFDVLTKPTVSNEKRLMIDPKTVKDSYLVAKLRTCHKAILNSTWQMP